MKPSKILITVLLILFFLSNIFSQSPMKFSLKENANTGRIAISYLTDFELSGAYVLSTENKNEDFGLAGLSMRVDYIGIGINYLKIKNNDSFGLNLTYGSKVAVIAWQLGVNYITDLNNNQLRILPKVGLTLLGNWTLYYGYNFNTILQNGLLPNNHIITLQATFP